jgi:hypothetical protein
MYERIKKYNKNTFVYLCMEFSKVYDGVFGRGRYNRCWFLEKFKEAYDKAIM